MMIKCTKCGFENQMGAIFCRQCGEKIDMNTVSPDALEDGKQKERRKEKIKKAIQRLFFFLILIAILGGLAAVFAPWGIKPFEEPGAKDENFEKEKETVIKKYADLSSEKTKKNTGSVAISAKDLNILYNEQVFPDPAKVKKEETDGEAKDSSSDAAPKKEAVKKSGFYVEHVSFSGKDNVLFITIYAKLGFVPVNCRIKGIPRRGENDAEPVAFDVQYISLGHLPVPCCRKKIVSMIGEKILTEDIKRIFAKAGNVSMKKDEIILSFGEAKPAGKEVKKDTSSTVEEKKQTSSPKKAKKKSKKKAKKD